MRKLALVVLAVVAGCAAPADTPDTTTTEVASPAAGRMPVPLTDQQVEGRAIYESMCVACHGPAGRGDGPTVASGDVRPPTFHTQDFAQASVASLMPRFQAALTGNDPSHPHMQHVASILSEEKFASALSYIPALAYPPELPGSAIAGQQVFEYRCAGCHGEDGRGNGRAAAALTTVRPADFTTDSLVAAGDFDALFARVRDGGVESVHGSSMPPWGVVLSDGEIWDLVTYLATFQDGHLSVPIWMD